MRKFRVSKTSSAKKRLGSFLFRSKLKPNQTQNKTLYFNHQRAVYSKKWTSAIIMKPRQLEDQIDVGITIDHRFFSNSIIITKFILI